MIAATAGTALLPAKLLAMAPSLRSPIAPPQPSPWDYETADNLALAIAVATGQAPFTMGRIHALTVGVMRSLVWKRDQGLLRLNEELVAEHLTFDRLVALRNEVPSEEYRMIAVMLSVFAMDSRWERIASERSYLGYLCDLVKFGLQNLNLEA